MMIIIMFKKSNIISDLMAQPVERSSQYARLLVGQKLFLIEDVSLSLYIYII